MVVVHVFVLQKVCQIVSSVDQNVNIHSEAYTSSTSVTCSGVSKPYAPLPRQKAAVEVNARARPVSGGERSDSNESIPSSAARQDGTHTPMPLSNSELNRAISSDTVINPSLSNDQSVRLPADNGNMIDYDSA